MAFDQNSVPKDLRPLNIVRNVGEDPRIGPASSGFYTNAPPADPRIANAMPTIYYQTTVQDPAFLPFGYNSNAISGWVPHVVPSQPQQSLESGSAISSASGDDSLSGRKVKFLCSFDGKILPRLSDGALRYVGGQTRIISVRRDISFAEFIRKMIDMYEAQDVVIKYQLPDEDLDALVSVSCPDDLENMMDEYEKLTERSSDGHSAKLRIFLFSPSELENAGLARIGDLQEGGQRYVEAVNGIMDGISGRTGWKGSVESAISAQNSDVSTNNDTADNTLGHGLGEVIGVAPSAGGLLLPKGSPVVVPSNPVSYVDPVVRSGLSKQEVTPNLVLASPPGVSLQKVSPYVQSYMEPQQESSKNANYVQVSPQMGGYAGPSLGPMRPVFNQPPQQFAHAMHMTMNPALSQPQHVRMDHFSAEQGYNAHPTQIPTQGGIYNWHQTPHPEKIAFSEASLSPQQVILSEKISRFEDCHMCQKALPHAHSDTIAQEQKESPTSNTTDIRSIYSSIHFDGRGRPMVRPVATETMAEKNVQPTGSSRLGIASISGNHESGDIRTPDAIGVPQNVEGMQYVIDKASPQNPELQNKATLPQGMMMASGGQYPYGVFVANTPQPVQNLNFQPHLQVVQDGKPLLNDDFAPVIKPLQTNKDHVLHETPNAYAAKVVSGGVPIDEATSSASDNLRQIDERLENLRIRPSEVLSNDESRKEDAMENKSAHTDHAAETISISPVSEWMDNIAWSQPKTTGGVVEADRSSSISPSYGVPDIPDNSSSLFSNQDPWNMRPDTTHSPPPKPSKIQIRKESGLREENRLMNNSEAQRDLLLETPLDHSLSNKGSAEEQIKQELQAVAEGVAASVLHSPIPSNLDDPKIASPPLVLQNGDFQPSNDDIQHREKLEEMKTKLSEKTNLGVPASDMGRLQIIRNSDLEELRELGSGTFGTVYHGKWRGTDVAIKRINERCFAGKPSEQDRMRDDFWNEAIKLADLHHPNVVAFYGVVLDGPDGSVATVTEYMVNGSLRNSLQKNERNLDKRKRLLIGMDVAFGMEYLHGKNIVHFDLKSDNLLVNLRDPHRPICKVGDLGLSKVKCQTLISGGVRGTLPWMAPELLNGSSSLVSEKVDVFSFGIVMWELITGEEPYADLHYGAIIGGIVSNTLRPHVPESCDHDWRSLMERCWSPEPSERPNFTDIANELRTMASKLPSKGQAQQQLPSTSPQPKS